MKLDPRIKMPLIAALILALVLPALSCRKMGKVELVATPYHENALYNFHLGRTYMAEGRYELARERYLLALACSYDDDLSVRAAQELEAAERQIQTQR